jgi:protein-disulfide isomerase
MDIEMHSLRRNHVFLGLAVLIVVGLGFAVWRSGLFAEMFGGADLLQAGPLGEQAIGDANAPITIIEYASMSCPHCAEFSGTTFPELKRRYIDSGKVRFIFREFPLDPLAEAAAMLPRCAPEDKFFAAVDTLFATQENWRVEQPLEPLLAAAQQAGFTQDSFKACLQDQTILDGIEWVRTRAHEKFKVMSTPAFFVNGKVHEGNLSIEGLERLMQP